MNRRRFLLGAGGLILAAPAIVRAASLMPVSVLPPTCPLSAAELARLRKIRLDYFLHRIQPSTTEAFADLVCYGRSVMWVNDHGVRVLRPIEFDYAEAIMQAVSQ